MSSYSYDQHGEEMGNIRRTIKDLQQRRRNGEDVRKELAEARGPKIWPGSDIKGTTGQALVTSH